MRRHITSALWAAAIVALSMYAAGSTAIQPITLRWLAEAVPMVAIHALHSAGRRGGAEGLPPLLEIVLLTFVLWWLIVEAVRTVWRRLRSPSARR